MNPNKILILGNGQLGQILARELADGYIVSTINKRLDGPTEHFGGVDRKVICNWPKELREADVIINTIATSNTRVCEENPEQTYFANTGFPLQLAKRLLMLNKEQHLIHISTGCIFDGNKQPHFENSAPTPHIAYARQKLVAEGIMEIYPRTTILRPRMIFSDLELPSNLLKKVQGFSQFLNEPNSMTCAYDIVNFIDVIIKQDISGIFNFCNEGLTSPYLIKQLINEVYGIDSPVFHVSKRELHKKLGLQLTDTWIESKTLKDFYTMPRIEDRLREMIGKSSWLATEKQVNESEIRDAEASSQ